MNKNYNTEVAVKSDKTLKAILIGILLFSLAVFLWASVKKAVYPYQIDHGEVSVLYETYLLTNGKNLYPDLNAPPYIATIYTPLYYLVTAPLIKVFGVSYLPGRMFSILASFSIALALFFIVKRITENTWVSSLTALLPFVSHFFYSSAPVARVDMLGLMLVFWGLFFALRKETFKALLLMYLAIMTKQSLVALPLAFFTHQFFFGDKKRAISTGLVFIASGLISVFLLSVLTDGFFMAHTFRQSNVPYSITQLFAFKYKLLIMYPVILSLALFTLYDSFRKREIGLLHFFFITGVLTSFTVGYKGATINHHLEFFLLITLLFGIGLGKLYASLKPNCLSVIHFLLIVQMAMLFHLPNLPDKIQKLHFFYHFSPPPDQVELTTSKKVSNYVRQAEGKVLSLPNGDFCLVNGKEMEIETLFFSERRKLGLWDPSDLINSISKQEYALIITWNRLPEMRLLGKKIRDAIERHYERIDEINYIDRSKVTRGGGQFIEFHYNIFKSRGY